MIVTHHIKSLFICTNFVRFPKFNGTLFRRLSRHDQYILYSWIGKKWERKCKIRFFQYFRWNGFKGFKPGLLGFEDRIFQSIRINQSKQPKLCEMQCALKMIKRVEWFQKPKKKFMHFDKWYELVSGCYSFMNKKKAFLQYFKIMVSSSRYFNNSRRKLL